MIYYNIFFERFNSKFYYYFLKSFKKFKKYTKSLKIKLEFSFTINPLSITFTFIFSI